MNMLRGRTLLAFIAEFFWNLLATYGLMSLFWPLTRSEFLRLSTMFAIMAMAALALTFLRQRRLDRMARRWQGVWRDAGEGAR